MTDSSFPAWLAAQAEREARGLTRRLVEVDCGEGCRCVRLPW